MSKTKDDRRAVLLWINKGTWEAFSKKHGKNKLNRLRELVALDVEREG
jgi:hypothetical protein